MASEIQASLTMPPLNEAAQSLAAIHAKKGKWSEEEYFRLEAEHYIEFVNGDIEFLPVPSPFHAAIAFWLAQQLQKWVERSSSGVVYISPVSLKLPNGQIRQPDIFVSPKHSATSKHLTSAPIAIEVVSEGAENRHRDYIVKREVYAQAGIPEYWIVDPEEKAVTVLKLDGAEYVVHGRFTNGDVAPSATLEGFSVNCGEIWELEKDL